MGWLWASPSPPKPSSPANDKPTSQPPPAPKHSDNFDPELQKFLDLFKADTSSSPASSSSSSSNTSVDAKPTTASSSPDDKPSTSSSWFSLRATGGSNNTSSSSSQSTAIDTTPSTLDPVSEDLLPTDMSCRQAFDLAWACNSIGGQWNAVYRNGTMRSCSENWDDFWFCMRVKSYGPEARERAIREHYRRKEHNKYGPGKPSSEDIWQAREQIMPPGTAFTKSMDIPSVEDEEWQRMELERRRQIREKLGFDKATS